METNNNNKHSEKQDFLKKNYNIDEKNKTKETDQNIFLYDEKKYYIEINNTSKYLKTNKFITNESFDDLSEKELARKKLKSNKKFYCFNW